MKTCFKCGEHKPLVDFYKHQEMADGHLNKCKECTKKDVRANRADNLEYYRDYDKKRANNDNRVEGRARYASTDAGKASRAAAATRWIERNPVKRSAQIMVGNALRAGILVKGPCEVCGNTTAVHGHHDDYAQPLVVRWLCPKHHSEWHLNNKPLFGGKPLKDEAA